MEHIGLKEIEVIIRLSTILKSDSNSDRTSPTLLCTQIKSPTTKNFQNIVFHNSTDKLRQVWNSKFRNTGSLVLQLHFEFHILSKLEPTILT